MHGKTSELSHDGQTVFEGLSDPLTVGRYHSLALQRDTLPEELVVTPSAIDDGEVMGLRHRDWPVEGLQFHPESVLTPEGKEILKNFVDHYLP